MALLNQWGLLQHDLGNPDAAEQQFNEAKTIAERLPTNLQVLSAAARNNLALLNRDRGDGRSAIELLQSAIADQLRAEGATPRTATLLYNLADTYGSQDQPDCAGPLIVRRPRSGQGTSDRTTPDNSRIRRPG